MRRVSRQRIVLILEYDGYGLCGWQRQDNACSVQQHLEEALARIEGIQVSCVAAGRTDAGVHAEAMAVHADVQQERFSRSPMAYVHGANQYLPEKIKVIGVRAVQPEFHARFDCRERAYRYQIWNRSTASAIERWRHWWMPRTLDAGAMQKAATYLIGRHDFSSFRASGCQAATTLREVRDLRVVRRGHCVCIEVRANAFLYHMVRNIVGSLVHVGIGKWRPEQMAELLEAGDRSLAADTAPAHGLYFTDAVYDAFRTSQIVGCS